MKRLIALVLALVCVVGLASCGTADNDVSSKDETSNTTSASEEAETQGQETQSTEVVMEYFETDLIVNNFFVAYNAIAENPIDVTEIEKGNIKTKALVYIDDFSMEVINAADSLSVSISVADDEISTAWNSIHETGYVVENYDFNGIRITYVPSKELSWGTSALRIDLSFPLIYG